MGLCMVIVWAAIGILFYWVSLTPVPEMCYPMAQWLLPPSECVPDAPWQAWCICSVFALGLAVVVCVIGLLAMVKKA